MLVQTERGEVETDDIDFPTFLHLFNEQRGFETSHPQFLMAEWLQAKDNFSFRLIEVYRGAGKTDVTNAWVCWKLFRDPNWTVVIVSATDDVAAKKARAIRSMIGTFWLIKHLKPTDMKTALWKEDRFTVERTHQIADPSVYITSVNADFTGQRGRCLLADDWESDKNAASDTDREKIWNRYEDLVPLVSEYVWVGTPHAEPGETIYDKLMDLPVGYKRLAIPVMDKDGTPANPDVSLNGRVQNKEWIESIQHSISSTEFKSQYLLERVRTGESRININLVNIYSAPWECTEIPSFGDDLRSVDFQFSVNGDVLKDATGYWDPAYGGDSHDDSALVIAGNTRLGHVYVPYAVMLSPVEDKEDFAVQCEEVVAACASHGITKVHVETNFSPTLTAELKRAARRLHKRIRVEPIRRTGNKATFIFDQVEPLIRTGHLYVHENVWSSTPLRQQIAEFPKGKHDDFIDALAGAISALKQPRVRPGRNDGGDPTIRQTPRSRVVHELL